MITLKITTGVTIAIVAGIGVAAYVFYMIGKKSTNKKNISEKYIKSNPNTIQAQRAFVENLDKLLPYFSGVTEIKIDKQGLTDAIIGINNEDLIAIWKKW